MLLWTRHCVERQLMAAIHGAPPTELELWHGTRATPTLTIFNGADGFDMRFSKKGVRRAAQPRTATLRRALLHPAPCCTLPAPHHPAPPSPGSTSTADVGASELLCRACSLQRRICL